MSPNHYHKIIVVPKFGVCFTIGRLVLTAYVTFSFSWGLCNVVLLLFKALSFRAQEIKASAHQFHEGAVIVV